MAVFVWAVALPACLVALVLIVRRPVRQIAEEMCVEHARALFHQQREWLEARFLGALGKTEPTARVRWEEAHWHDEVLWARDRQTRRLLAMIGVHFDPPPFADDDDADGEPRHATALFEFRKGRWHAEGKRLEEVQPGEAVLTSPRFEVVLPHPPRRA